MNLIEITELAKSGGEPGIVAAWYAYAAGIEYLKLLEDMKAIPQTD